MLVVAVLWAGPTLQPNSARRCLVFEATHRGHGNGVQLNDMTVVEPMYVPVYFQLLSVCVALYVNWLLKSQAGN
jgi:hypothetical protein